MSENLFFIKFSKLSGNRFDPKYNDYISKYKVALEKSAKLGSLLTESPKYGANESAVPYNNNCRYIRITDIDKFGLLKSTGIKSAEFEEEKYKLEVNDILFARSGATVGKAYIHKNAELNAIFAGYMIRFKIDENKINPDYIFYYTQLNIYKEWVSAIQRSAGQPNINAEEYQDLDIAIPTKDIQNKVILKMKEAYKLKDNKEKEAQGKLDSINDYLLNELGIELPSDKKENLQDRIFIRNFSNISGNRIDPFYNHIYYAKIDTEIENGKFSVKSIKDLCYAVNGVIYSGSDERKEGKAILRGNNITLKTNEINFDNIRYIRDDINLPNNLLLKSDDIFMSSASGSKEHVGKVAYIYNDLDYYFGGFMMVLRKFSDNYIQKYLFEFLQSKIFRAYLFKNLGGTNINNLNFNMLSNLKIPLPSIQKQSEITSYIQILRNEAKTLRDEANKIYEDSKKEVEKMILGDD